MDDSILKEVVANRDYQLMVSVSKSPEPGEYVVTGIQAGNHQGEQGWHLYVGYVVQVRKKAGAFGSDLILLRHPDGTLMQHHNQSFYRMESHWEQIVKDQFLSGMNPDSYEDYLQPYTLGNKESPEVGRIIEAKPDVGCLDCGPFVSITTTHSDGSKVVEVV